MNFWGFAITSVDLGSLNWRKFAGCLEECLENIRTKYSDLIPRRPDDWTSPTDIFGHHLLFQLPITEVPLCTVPRLQPTSKICLLFPVDALPRSAWNRCLESVQSRKFRDKTHPQESTYASVVPDASRWMQHEVVKRSTQQRKPPVPKPTLMRKVDGCFETSAPTTTRSALVQPLVGILRRQTNQTAFRAAQKVAVSPIAGLAVG